jgi:DNA replication and repair protein RecF
MQPLGIERLRLSHFRSYGYLDLNIHAKHIVLTGQNGIGKTNLLEAISFLSPGRGLRKSKLNEIIQMGQPQPWVIHAAVFDGEDTLSLATGLDPLHPSRRIVKVQGESIATQAELGHYINVSWVTPAMDRLFLEPSSVRRKFFDRMVYGIDPLHAERLSNYKHAMMERNRLLKERSVNKAWLDALEITMAQESIAIAGRRVETLQLLQEAQPFSDDHYFPSVKLEFSEGIERSWYNEQLLDLEETLLSQLAANRSVDAMMGGAQIGAHKMDFVAVHGIKNLNAAICSTGEQKILLMWIVLAFAKLNTLKSSAVNILLLDEVTAHLDAERRHILFDKINNLNVQAWYSGTDHSLFSGLEGYSTQSYHLDAEGVKGLI